ncbi:NuoI/complex I 23 kDa subunit family protein [Thermodesulfobacteriota bacterium]
MEGDRKLSIFEKLFFVEIIKGHLLTLKYLFSKPVTIQYPKEKRDPVPKSRGIHTFKLDADGTERCNGCGICAKFCPAYCIETKGEKVGDKRVVTIYNVDLTRCIFCGMCADACPKDAITMVEAYEFSAYNKEDLHLDKKGMRKNSSKVPS